MSPDLGSLAMVMMLYTAWSFLIGLTVEGVKRASTSARDGETPRAVVRLLPLSGMLLGMASGPAMLPLILDMSGVVIPEEHLYVIPWLGGMSGFGAGAVASQVVKTYKQTLLGQDKRLER